MPSKRRQNPSPACGSRSGVKLPARGESVRAASANQECLHARSAVAHLIIPTPKQDQLWPTSSYPHLNKISCGPPYHTYT
ncbi:hypothetical protein RRG08_019208 [Elysia crispata]|uniref:Uncharacterized protein n=1 Tax=Elysia crispata TaxID=231223 RepID=A0AAE1E4V0_9GAST|nr:hypothetical protein RRG08_019208 [Elysia crispata]